MLGPASYVLQPQSSIPAIRRLPPFCQRPFVSPQLRPSFLPIGGHDFSPLAAIFSLHFGSCWGSGEGLHPLSCGCLREPVAVLPFCDQDVGIVQKPVDGRGRDALGHQFLKAGRVNVGADRDRSFFVGGADDPEQRLGRVGGHGQEADVIDTTRSARMSLPIALLTESSARWRRSSCASVSSVCHATVLPLSIARWPSASTKWLLPVPLGPQTHNTSARSIHSRVLSACWALVGIAERSRSQASKVLPAGSPDARRLVRMVAWSRPVAFSESSTRRTSACFPALAGGVGDHLGRRPTDVWEPEPPQQAFELVRQRWRGGWFDRHRLSPNRWVGRFSGQGIGRGECLQGRRSPLGASVLSVRADIGVFIVRIPPSYGSSVAASVPRGPGTGSARPPAAGG
jgi:hypothetical protein